MYHRVMMHVICLESTREASRNLSYDHYDCIRKRSTIIMEITLQRSQRLFRQRSLRQTFLSCVNRWSLGQYQQWTAIGMIKLPEWSSLNFNTLRRHSTWASLKRYLIPERYHLKLTCLLFLLFFDKILKIPRELKTEAQVHPDHLTP